MENIATMEEMKAEALERMKEMDIIGAARQDFRFHSNVWISEMQRMGGRILPVIYDMDGYSFEDDVKPAVEKVLSDGKLPYHVIVCWVDGMLWTNVLYVTQNKEEWEYDREDMSDGLHLAYVAGFSGEYGSIGIKPMVGGIVRTY